MTVDLSTLKAGDEIRIKIGSGYIAEAIKNGRAFPLFHQEILEIIPKAFDWADVRPGMAFRWVWDNYIYYYIGKSTHTETMVFECSNDQINRFVQNSKKLTRAPDYDIEVPA